MEHEYSKLLTDERINEELISSQASEVEKALVDLSAKNDYSSDEYIQANQKLVKLTDLLNKIQKFKKLFKDLEDAQSLLMQPDFKDLADEEIKKVETDLEETYTYINKLIQKPLINDEKKAIMEFRPGVGGVEASLFAEELYRSYLRFCNAKGYTVEHVSLDYDTEGGIKEAILLINTPGSYGDLRFEAGVHRVQRVPKTESAGRIHTSTASIAIIPQFEKKDININPDEIRIDVFRAGGPGGQSVNTTDSAVRVFHIPTGITVSCQQGKSQHKNKEIAISILASKLQEIEEEKHSSQEKELRTAAIKSGDRSAKIRTYNFPQGRITDHRIQQSWFNIDSVMQGEISEIIETVATTLRNGLST
jgi:peptide chain release factor 1